MQLFLVILSAQKQKASTRFSKIILPQSVSFWISSPQFFEYSQSLSVDILDANLFWRGNCTENVFFYIGKTNFWSLLVALRENCAKSYQLRLPVVYWQIQKILCSGGRGYSEPFIFFAENSLVFFIRSSCFPVSS